MRGPTTASRICRGWSSATARSSSISGARMCRDRVSWAWRFTEWTTRPTTPFSLPRLTSRPDDSARHAHAVQYVSHPTYPWQKLRAEHPGEYEKSVTPAPDPSGWFHVRIVVASPKVSVFVADATEPSWVVSQLSNRHKGRGGLWVGNGSDGDFANLRIVR